MPIKVIAFDADDTLWHNETRFREAENFFKDLLGDHAEEPHIDAVLYRHEIKNIASFGYGAKTFTLSMIEAALEISKRQITAKDVEDIIRIGNEIINEPLVVFDHVETVLQTLSEDFKLMVLTKGDLMEQENKIRRSDLGRYFDYTEIVTEKSAAVYRGILERHRLDPMHFLMVGNSLKSDVFPAREIGAQAIHIPYHTTWVHEQVPSHEAEASDHLELQRIEELIPLSRHWLDRNATGKHPTYCAEP